MNGLRLLVLGGLALSLALPQLVLAADGQSQKVDETQSHDRGIMFPNINGAVAAPVTTVTPVVVPAKVDVPKSTAGDTKKPLPNKMATVKPARKPIISAHPKTSKPANSKTEVAKHSPAKPVESQNTDSSDALLVGYKQQDGAVITASLDKRGDMPKYRVGDNLVVNVKAHQDCNVVVFNYDSTGTLTQIFPNDYQQNGFVRANEAIEIGGADSKFDYQIAGKGGPEKIFVYAYPTGEKNPLTVALNPIPGTPFRGGEMTVEQYRNMLNNSPIFHARSVQVVPRKTSQHVSSQAPASTNNKIELTFMVDK